MNHALAYLVDSFNPVIIHIWGPLSVRWYGVAYVCGFIGGYLLWLKAVRDKLVPFAREEMEMLLTWAVAGVLIGGRLGYMLLYDLPYFLEDPLSIIRVDRGGMAFHGGMLGVIMAVGIFAWRKKLPFLAVADLCAMAAPVGLLFGRLANFVNGELWGRISTRPWAMLFPNAPYLPTEPTVYFETALGSGLTNPRHPSQLYEAALEGLLLGAITITLFWFRKGAIPRKAPGLIGGIFLVFYASSRILCEGFREPDASLILGMTRGTFYSMVMAVAGAAVVAFTANRALGIMKKEENAATYPTPSSDTFKADKSRFDKGAATWDENSERKARSNVIAGEYGKIIDTMGAKPEVFDYGCGTGQSILPVAAKCAGVTGGDFSEGMLEKFTENAKAAGLGNTKTLCRDLAALPAPDASYDLITSSMTLHHIADIPTLLGKFAAMQKAGGRIALVDLETEDGSFHSDNEGVAHMGFDKDTVARWLAEAGYNDVAVRTIYLMKKTADGREYPLFLATGTRR